MADQALTFRLLIDNKEASATLDVTKGQFVELGEQAEKPITININQPGAGIEETTQKISDGIQLTAEQIQQEEELFDRLKLAARGSFEDTGEAAEDLSDNLGENFDGMNVSIKDLLERLEDLKAKFQGAIIGSEEQGRYANEIINVNAQLDRSKASLQGTTQATHGLNLTQRNLQSSFSQLGNIVGNADHAFGNFQEGMRTTSHILPELVHGLNMAREGAASTGKSFISQLLPVFASGGGLMLGLQGFMLLLQLLPDLFEDTTDKIKEQKEEIKKFEEELSKIEKRVSGYEFTSIEQSFETQEEYNKKKNEQIEKTKGMIKAEKEAMEDLIAMDARAKKAYQEGADVEKLEEYLTPHVFGMIKENADNLKSYNDELANLRKEKNFFNDVLDRTDGKLVGLKEKIQTQIITSDDWKSTIAGLTNNEIKALVGSLDNSNNKLKRSSEEYVTATANLDKLRELTGKQSQEEDKFADTKQKAVDKFIQEEFKKTEAVRLSALTYKQLLTELENAEKDYSTVLQQVKAAQTQTALDAVIKFANLTETRIDLIKNAVKGIENAGGDNKFWKSFNDMVDRHKDSIEKRQKLEEEKNKFFATLPGTSKTEELKIEEETMIKRAQLYGATEEQITNIRAYYTNQRAMIAEEEAQAELDLLQQKLSQVQSAYGQFYSIISQNVSQEISAWKSKEEQKLEAERKSALQHAKTEKQKQNINEDYDQKKAALEAEADKRAQARLETWFNMQKALAIAEITINLAKAIGVEWGKLGTFALFTQGFIVAALSLQLAAVAGQKFPKGFETGGRLPKGKAGIFEGTGNEIVAPESDFKTYSAELTRQALIEARNYINISAGANSGEDLRAIKTELTALREDFKSGSIKANAYLDDREAKKIYNSGGRQNRRGKI